MGGGAFDGRCEGQGHSTTAANDKNIALSQRGNERVEKTHKPKSREKTCLVGTTEAASERLKRPLKVTRGEEEREAKKRASGGIRSEWFRPRAESETGEVQESVRGTRKDGRNDDVPQFWATSRRIRLRAGRKSKDCDCFWWHAEDQRAER